MRTDAWSGEIENYTPSKYVELVRAVMGSIDIDPASSDLAQRTVKAKTYYTQETDGLSKEWRGNIFLNPPYKHPDIRRFVCKLLNSLGDDTQAILLTNNNTDTEVFHLAAQKADAICFTKGRIKFNDANGRERPRPTNGQIFFYFGKNKEMFIKYFSDVGTILERIS